MIYKGQKLSDNLTQSQINMYKYMIDKGVRVGGEKIHNIEEIIMKVYTLDDKVNRALREPDVEEKIEALKE